MSGQGDYRDAMAAGRAMARRYQHALEALAVGQTVLLAYVPLDRFVPLLAQGWRFCGHVVEPMHGHHGQYSCLMEKMDNG